MTFSFLRTVKTRLLFAGLLISVLPGFAGDWAFAPADPTFTITAQDTGGVGATTGPIDDDYGDVPLDPDRISRAKRLQFTEVATGVTLTVEVFGNYIGVSGRSPLTMFQWTTVGLQTYGNRVQVSDAGFHYKIERVTQDGGVVSMSQPIDVVADTFEDVPHYTRSIYSIAWFDNLRTAIEEETYEFVGSGYNPCYQEIIDNMIPVIDFLFETGTDLDVVNALNDLYLAMERNQDTCSSNAW
ncbi:hypothetical protein SCOR_01220 [Sulfidibacter corallicola]|uniref:Uncharacterized protein n=1 Tax=Sulfidibacter corallicola TaxID=2818388 RepID=A0A8A4TGU1_SULCO|nr:hypothetical protein [Sulfidibacter corallicola]QTD48853.1 hypothetical protein J3U87_24995 [Sulfidibacter corallicola]